MLIFNDKYLLVIHNFRLLSSFLVLCPFKSNYHHMKTLKGYTHTKEDFNISNVIRVKNNLLYEQCQLNASILGLSEFDMLKRQFVVRRVVGFLERCLDRFP